MFVAITSRQHKNTVVSNCETHDNAIGTCVFDVNFTVHELTMHRSYSFKVPEVDEYHEKLFDVKPPFSKVTITNEEELIEWVKEKLWQEEAEENQRRRLSSEIQKTKISDAK